jgi:MraZ protein
MDQKFRGRFEATIDQKGRLLLPSSLRDVLGNLPLVLTNSQFRKARCLDGYSLVSWEHLEKKISGMSPLKVEIQAFQRFYLANAQVLETDSNNRILVPKNLREYAELEDDVVILGMGEKIEIWSESKWKKLYEDLADSFEDTLAAVASLESKDKT